MPNRLVREGLMESEAVLSLPVEGRWLFVIIILSADDVGLFEATEFKLARRADVNRELAGKLMTMIADADLIRIYEVERKRYGFIPKFRQRLQIKTTKHPLPPAALYQDDPDASNKFNNLASKTTVGAPVGSGCAGDGQPPESESESELEAEVKKVPETPSPRRRRKASDIPACPFDGVVALYHEVLPELPQVRVMKPGGARHRAVQALWTWVLTSERNGQRRATTAEEALAWLREYFTRARANDWLMGRTPKGQGHENWQCDIDFLCSEAGMKHVIEKTRERA